MTPEEQAVTDTEAWFVAHGLPYFVDDLRSQVRVSLQPGLVVPLLVMATTGGAAMGLLVGTATNADTGTLVGVLVALAVITAYGVARLHVTSMARWALARTFGSLGLLFPLATRALPLLLLFVTFLFINTEVWQVASNLDDGVLWGAVLLFAAVAVGFLLVRLPEELDKVDDEIGGERLVASCARTPMADVAPRYADAKLTEIAQVHGFEKGNLVFVLLVVQAVQVLLLALSVFAFFVVFGAVAIREPVMESWLDAEPHWLIDGWHVLSVELLQVSTFLASFSGLYFTVYAVNDDAYRRQFFASLARQLDRAVGVRAVYQSLRQG
ncbi:hypothetical protein [Nocardioides speluncae]|uniref:hypothetical protein n=1 Tax=Nocardioides speluncae TaxID=2670337 RepID=UPI000D68696A|nr:hypothetical protein [Nocardioides speluncae]